MGADESLRLDPAAATGVINTAAQAGVQAATAGAAEGVVGSAGVSPVDAAVVVVSTEEFAVTSGFRVVLSGRTVNREAGETGGVAMMSETETQNALRLGEIGPEGAAATAPSTITI